MKLVGVFLGAATLVNAPAALGDDRHVVVVQTRLDRPHTIGLELGGRALLYSLQYDRAVSERLSTSIGFMVFPSFNPGAEPGEVTTYYMVPVGAHLYLKPSLDSVFATFFTSACWGCRDDGFGHAAREWTLVPGLGVGYEHRGRSGGVVRLAAYALIREGRVYPWVGLHFGKAFAR